MIEGGLAAFVPLLAIARGAGVDELGVDCLQRLVSDAQTVGDAFAKVLDKDVGLGRQGVDHLYGLGLFEIQGDGALVAIVGLEIPVDVLFGRDAAGGGQVTPGIAGAGLLDLDHLGPHVAQHGAADGTLLPDGPIENKNSFEGEGHS